MSSSAQLGLAESASSSALRELGNASNRRRATIPPTMANTDEGFRRPNQAVGHMRLFVNGVSADVSLDSDGLRWSPYFEDGGGGASNNLIGNGQGLFFCFPMLEASAVNSIPFKEMLCAEKFVHHSNPGVVDFFNLLQEALSSAATATATATNSSTDSIPKPVLHGFSIHTFRRSASKPSEWHPWRLDIESENGELIETLLSEISNSISAVSATRPHRILLILNPNAGSGAARAHYRNILQPLLSQAGISAHVVETERAGHARQIVLEALRSPIGTDALVNGDFELKYDGIVAVGGDGIFHEILNGLLEAQKHAPVPVRPFLSSLRLAHIPCGSTDAVACSLHGCRSVFTAAMHMALGDSTPLDALKVSIGGTVRYACCIATYGFMGDVVQESEQHRWLGPLRYDIIGAMKIVHNQSYKCRIKYIPAPRKTAGGRPPTHAAAVVQEEDEGDAVESVCVANCSICRAASKASLHQDLPSSITANTVSNTVTSETRNTSTNNDDENFKNFKDGRNEEDQRWHVIEGEWMSIMLIVQPCRSDKTPYGMARYGHLNNGRFTLVLVRKCSPFNYLRFLATMSSSGLAPGLMPGVLEVYDAVACKVESMGGTGDVTSHWNIDGEIVQGVDMEAHAQIGAVQCFARGIET